MGEKVILVYLVVCFFVFLAGFVDSIAGGGGLISLPAYMIAGLPPHTAIATNKMRSVPAFSNPIDMHASFSFSVILYFFMSTSKIFLFSLSPISEIALCISLAPICVQSPCDVKITFPISTALSSEATLSFMGIGLPIEIITWGSMLSLSD